MGDRTSTITTVAASDLHRVKNLLLGDDWQECGHDFTHEDENDDGTVSFFQEDINYGGEYDAHILQEAEIPFIIEHESGGSYPAGLIVFDGEKRDSFNSFEGSLMLSFDEKTGEADQHELALARSFIALRKKTLECMIQRAHGQSIMKQFSEEKER